MNSSFEFDGVTYAAGHTTCHRCQKEFDYSYIPGYPPSSMIWCYDCDPTYPEFIATFNYAGPRGSFLMMTVDQRTSALFKSFKLE